MRPGVDGEGVTVTEAQVVYVNVDQSRKPVPITREK